VSLWKSRRERHASYKALVFSSSCIFFFHFGCSLVQICTGIKSCMKTGTVRKILSSGAKMKICLHFLRLLFSSFKIWNKRSAYNALVRKTVGHFESK